MMGQRQVDQAALLYEFSLERHVPASHLLRSIDRFVGRVQLIAASHSENFSAGVWESKVFRGLSFSCVAIALSLVCLCRDRCKRALGTRAPVALPQGSNQRWSLDFVSDNGTELTSMAIPR